MKTSVTGAVMMLTLLCGPPAQAQPPPLRADAKVVTTRSGLKYVDVWIGKGVATEDGRKVSVLYTGWLADGRTFDSRTDRSKPYAFELGMGKVIKGWDEGVLGMRVGGRRRLIIPAKLAYGPRGVPGRIPPNSELTFDVDLVGVARKAPGTP
jgi:peptidylprolyl isomerase